MFPISSVFYKHLTNPGEAQTNSDPLVYLLQVRPPQNRSESTHLDVHRETHEDTQPMSFGLSSCNADRPLGGLPKIQTHLMSGSDSSGLR